MKLNIDVESSSLSDFKTINYLDDPKLPEKGDAPIIIVQRVFERLKDNGPDKFLISLRKSLCENGIVYMYAINHDAAQQYVGGGIAFYPAVFGSNYHGKSIWLRNYQSKEAIIEIFKDFGFEYVADFEAWPGVLADYPCYKIVFRKAKLNSPHWYIPELKDKAFGKEEKVIDIGPGNWPWFKATHFFDHPSRKGDPSYNDSKIPKENMIWGDIQKTNSKEIENKSFDFALSSHIFEHLSDPVAAAEEISRIAKRGILVVPSAYKDCQTFFEEETHLWDCYPPHPGSNKLIMVKRNKTYINEIRNQEMRSIMGKLYREESYETREQRYVKRWYLENEHKLDIMIQWEDKLEVVIL